MAGFGLCAGLLYNQNSSSLVRPLAYSHCSCKWLARLLIYAGVAIVTVFPFVNPFWSNINMSATQKAVFVWMLQNVGFFLGILSVLAISPRVLQKCGLECY